ncbi:MAG: hypothetical protein CMH50_10125 [Myxococcales bacterium]|nr:hypothetical protein [Myxococcales bacterium]
MGAGEGEIDCVEAVQRADFEMGALMRRLFTVMLFALMPGLAQATVAFMSEVPNVRGQSCNTCHVSGGGSPRNSFGQDFWDLGGDWAELWQVDSDGDGFSNGFELGDPNGEWEKGQPAPGPYVSHPGDADDFPEGEPVPDAGPPVVDAGSESLDAGVVVDGGFADLEPDEPVGCSCEAVDNSTWMLFAGILVIGIVLSRRKGPRDRDR